MTDSQAADREERSQTAPDSWDGRAVVELMSTSHGRHLVERYLDYCGGGTDRYRHDGDALGTTWRDGLAHAGQFWEQLVLHHCPDLYLKMIRERRARLERARKQAELQEQRRDAPAAAQHTVAATIEELAEAQRREAEAELRRAAAEARRNKPKPKTKD